MKRILPLLVLTFILAARPTMAQIPGMGGSLPGFDPVMAKLFGKTKDFTANAEFNITEARQPKPITMRMTMSMSGDKARTEIDMANMNGGQIPASALDSMKKMGLDKITVIALPDENLSYMIYPNLHAYAPETNAAPATKEKDLKMITTSAGKDTVDGHPCEKNQVVVTDAKGVKHDVLLWNATDLKDFPIKMEMTENGTVIGIHFENIKLEKPSAALFNPPAGLKKYDTMQAMMQAEMMKHMGGAAGAPK